MHTYDEPTASFVAKGDDVAKDAAATIFRIGLASTIVGNVASFARLELNAVFGFSHLLELLYGEFIHCCYGLCFSIVFLLFFYPQQLVYIHFEEFCNLDECLHWWLASIGTPFTYCCWRTSHLFGKPLIGLLFIDKNHFYSVFHSYAEVICLRSVCTLSISK